MSCVGAFWRAARQRGAGAGLFFHGFEGRSAFRVALVGLAALATANCSGPPQVASHRRSSGSTIDPKYGVTASPRVVGENDPVPKGGGRQLVGRPYVIAGKTYVPRENPSGYVREGLASWYGTAFHGRLTANREIFDRYSIAAAHPTLPLPSYARVTNLANNASMIVRVNDRGPYHADRLMDVSQRVAEALDFRHAGTTRVRVEYVGKASLRGSDDQKLMATLRTDGRPAAFPGQAPTMLADAGDRFASREEPARIPLAFKPAPEAAPAPAVARPTVVAMATINAAPPLEPAERERAPRASATAVAQPLSATTDAYRPEATTVVAKRAPILIAARSTIEAHPATTVVFKRTPTLLAARITPETPAATTVIAKRVPTAVAGRTATEAPVRMAAVHPAHRPTTAEPAMRFVRGPVARTGGTAPSKSVQVAATPLPPGRPVDIGPGRADQARAGRAKVAGVY